MVVQFVAVFCCTVIVFNCLGPQGVSVCLDTMRQAFPATDSLQRTAKFFYPLTFRQSEAGIPIGPNLSTPASSGHALNLYTTPAPAFEVGWSLSLHVSLAVSWNTQLSKSTQECLRWPLLSALLFRLSVRRTRFTYISSSLSRIPVSEYWRQTLLPRFPMRSVFYRYDLWYCKPLDAPSFVYVTLLVVIIRIRKIRIPWKRARKVKCAYCIDK